MLNHKASLISLTLSCFFIFFLRQNLYVAQTNLEFIIPLPQSPVCWNYWHVPPCQSICNFLTVQSRHSLLQRSPQSGRIQTALLPFSALGLVSSMASSVAHLSHSALPQPSGCLVVLRAPSRCGIETSQPLSSTTTKDRTSGSAGNVVHHL